MFPGSYRRVAEERKHIASTKGETVADEKSGPSEGIKGVVEDAKGKAKEAAGAVTGQDSMAREGRAQQEKAESQREVAEKEAAAEKARGEAKADEERQRSEQQ